jgi:hypothetical protein
MAASFDPKLGSPSGHNIRTGDSFMKFFLNKTVVNIFKCPYAFLKLYSLINFTYNFYILFYVKWGDLQPMLLGAVCFLTYGRMTT